MMVASVRLLTREGRARVLDVVAGTRAAVAETLAAVPPGPLAKPVRRAAAAVDAAAGRVERDAAGDVEQLDEALVDLRLRTLEFAAMCRPFPAGDVLARLCWVAERAADDVLQVDEAELVGEWCAKLAAGDAAAP